MAPAHMNAEHDRSDLEAIEIDLFIEAMLRRFGYDFRDYGRASLSRRIHNLVDRFEADNIADLTARILHAPGRIAEVIGALSVPVSELFRDPETFRTLRTQVFPILASYPQVTIWQAGCARGEEVYSLAILLKEAGLYGRCRIFATDISKASLRAAAEGIYPAAEMREASRRYLESGGSESLSVHYHARYDLAKLESSLIENVTFAEHNLATDGVFCEAHLILCRNVMIYFNDRLQARALGLFAESLVRGGFLCVGQKENLLSAAAAPFQRLDRDVQLYRLRRPMEG
ncbi:protein-glutamate O-methyltransferase CheR [Aquabacter sp. L1I39]|uniref:CheR family methyltransferase n=1 Tax=Aquabacter sp. L1I39 TaxID=2820278 RepID=UPI001ADAF1EE|nr:protein-glutamate O-methyltransferase CheR [Aquabacter sp. L1I39]QTL02233.1 protein-glutamate O-methyltransferase CheR [Aquabacter sp. L1I39]